MKVICLLNEKGGCGKTTTATTLATLLAQRKYKVLLIDADSQGHATLSVRVKRRDGLYALLKENAPFDQVVTAVHPDYYGGDANHPALWLIPSSDYTAQLAQGLDARLLKSRLAQVSRLFDFAIIDTAPSINDLHLSFYVAADYLIYPTECTFMPMQGLFKSLQHRQDFITWNENERKQGRPAVNVADILGILPTRFNGRKSVQHQNYGLLRGKYGEDMVFSPMRFLTEWEKASAKQLPVNMLGYKNDAAAEAALFVDEVLQKLEAQQHG